MKRKNIYIILLCILCISLFSVSVSGISWKYTTASGEVWNETDNDCIYVREKIYSYLTDNLHLNDAACSGILGNIYCECGYDYTMRGNYNGLCQWYIGDRWDQCIELYGTSLEGQIKFIGYELTQGAFKNVYSVLAGVSNDIDGAYEAEEVWRTQYEIRGEQAINRSKTATSAYFIFLTEMRDGVPAAATTETTTQHPETTTAKQTTYSYTQKKTTEAQTVKNDPEEFTTVQNEDTSTQEIEIQKSRSGVFIDDVFIEAFAEMNETESSENVLLNNKQEINSTETAAGSSEFEGDCLEKDNRITAVLIIFITGISLFMFAFSSRDLFKRTAC